MTVKRSIEAKASDKTGMTLDELISWAEEAKSNGVPGEARPTATVKIGGQIKKVEVKG